MRNYVGVVLSAVCLFVRSTTEPDSLLLLLLQMSLERDVLLKRICQPHRLSSDPKKRSVELEIEQSWKNKPVLLNPARRCFSMSMKVVRNNKPDVVTLNHVVHGLQHCQRSVSSQDDSLRLCVYAKAASTCAVFDEWIVGCCWLK